jgi:hypothetical protein
VQPALLVVLLLPPPAAGAFRFSWPARACAGRAADRCEAFGMERIGWNALVHHEGQDRLPGPVEQRIDLEQATFGVKLDNPHFRTMRGLLTAQTGDPSFGASQSPVERFNLSDMAARDASLPGLIEAIDTLPGDELFEIVMARVDGADSPSIAALGFGPKVIGFREQAAGVERHHVDVGLQRAEPMENRLIFQPEAGGERELTRHFLPKLGNALRR